MNERFTKGRLYQLPRSTDIVHAEQGNRGRRICCTESMGDKAENEANARRIVATWNACAGISTEALETGPTMMEAYQREQDRADKAVLALEQLVRITCFDTLINAAREQIAERIEAIKANRFNDYTAEDLESAEAERLQMEEQAEALEAYTKAVTQEA